MPELQELQLSPVSTSSRTRNSNNIVRCYTAKDSYFQIHLPDPATTPRSQTTVGHILQDLNSKLAGKLSANNSKSFNISLRTHSGGTPIWLCESESIVEVLEDWGAVSQKRMGRVAVWKVKVKV